METKTQKKTNKVIFIGFLISLNKGCKCFKTSLQNHHKVSF